MEIEKKGVLFIPICSQIYKDINLLQFPQFVNQDKDYPFSSCVLELIKDGDKEFNNKIEPLINEIINHEYRHAFDQIMQITYDCLNLEYSFCEKLNLYDCFTPDLLIGNSDIGRLWVMFLNEFDFRFIVTRKVYSKDNIEIYAIPHFDEETGDALSALISNPKYLNY